MTARLVRGELRPGGSEREWCDVDVLRRLRRASLAALRREIEPIDAGAWSPSCRPGRASTATPAPARASTACARCSCPAGSRAAGRGLGARYPAAPRRRLVTGWLDELCASGELVWVGAGPHGRCGRVALYFREDAPALGPPPRGRRRAARRELHDALRGASRAAPAFFIDLGPSSTRPREQLARAVWDLVWAGRGDERRLGAAAAARLTLARPLRAAPARRVTRSRFAAGTRAARRRRRRAAGRSTAPLFARRRAGSRRAARALAELLLERYGS